MASVKVKIALVQSKAAHRKDANIRNALDKISQSAKQGAKIICLQELFVSRYFPQTEDIGNFKCAESISGDTIKAVSMAAKKHKVTIICPIFEKRTAGIYHNSAVIINSRGEIISKYRKMHIPDDPRFYEKYYFTLGDLGFQAVDTEHGKISVLICWDQWFPESARICALKGAQIIFYPTAIAWHKEESDEINKAQLESWLTIQQSHAIANGVFIASVNRVGKEDDLIFWGNSFVCEPTGNIIAQASQDKEEILYAECDLDIIEWQRKAWPFLRDRRIDAYDGLLSRYLDNENKVVKKNDSRKRKNSK